MTFPVKRAVAAAACAALLALLPCYAAADNVQVTASAESTAAVRVRLAPDSVRVYVGGLLRARAYMQNDTPYMSLADVGTIYGVDIEVYATEDAFSASAVGLELSGTAGSGYIEANHRYMYLPDGYINCEGDIYLPLDVICRIFTLNAEVTDNGVEISTLKPRMISGSENYYDTHFDADELYWLPHIAYVEALDQPLAGIMGVVSVVLNRVEDEDFPDGIFEVIYDTRHTVQFTPAATGSLHGKPTELYYIATYLVLEGYNTVGDSLYFVNPENNGNYWFRENLTLVATYGDHEFYR